MDLDKKVLYIVKSTVSDENAETFNRWYHEKHIPEMLERSGCRLAQRFQALEAEDRFVYMAIYEFENSEAFKKYQSSPQKLDLVKDFRDNFGEVAELKGSSWVQIHP